MSISTLARLLTETPIVVTGVGAVSAAGESVPALWRAVETGRVPAVWREFKLGGRQQVFAVCPAPDLDHGGRGFAAFRRFDRCAQMAWTAAQEAWTAAGMERFREQQRVGLMLGTSRGALAKFKEGFDRVSEKRYPPSLSADCSVASVSGVLVQGLNLPGPAATISATCASGAFAIALAAEQIVLGKADVMLAGAADAPLVASTVAQLQAAGVMGSHEDPARSCRPFDATRNGLCLGEGSGFLVLESAASAARRGAALLARLSGWGMSVDHSGRAGVSATGRGLVEVGKLALEGAGLSVDDIDAVNTHGTGTPLNDLAESRGLCSLFGSRIASVPCTSTKPVTGHCLGASPALEALICIEGLRQGIVPPTANCRDQDPDCRIVVQTGTAQRAPLRHVMSNSLGFWGYHASLIFSRYDEGKGGQWMGTRRGAAAPVE